jgi:Uma2 family endonuclease
MATTQAADGERLVLYRVPWEEYETLLKLWGDRRLRMTYDRGTLEIMYPSLEHGGFQHILARLIEMYCYERDLDIKGAGSVTFRRRLKDRGLEPDECYWLRNEPAMRGKREFDFETDPPPDLALEIEVTSSALDKMDIYAKLGFPEVWRYDGTNLHVHQLQADETYRTTDTSRNFPDLSLAELAKWARLGPDLTENRLLRAFAAWVRGGMPPGGADAVGRP